MSATTVLLTLPGDVVQRAVRVMVHLAAAAVVAPALALRGDVLTDYREAADAAAHEGDRVQCPHCQLVGHEIRWRGYPVLDPGPCPPSGVLNDLVEACACCFWGPSADPLYDRLERERHDDRDIHVEHLGRDGRWTRFETRF